MCSKNMMFHFVAYIERFWPGVTPNLESKGLKFSKQKLDSGFVMCSILRFLCHTLYLHGDLRNVLGTSAGPLDIHGNSIFLGFSNTQEPTARRNNPVPQRTGNILFPLSLEGWTSGTAFCGGSTN